LSHAKARLGLSDTPELSAVLAAVRRALDHNWLMEAEVLCRFILLNRPEQPDAWALRGEAAMRDGDWCSARLYFQEGLRCLDRLPHTMDTRRQRHTYWRAVAECNQRLNRREEAEAALLQAARFDPNAKVSLADPTQASALLARAYPLILQNQLDAAEPLIRAVLDADPANADGWQGLAVIEHKRGNHEQALAAIDRAIELKPSEAGYWNNRGVFLKPLGAPKIDERIAAYQKATALNPRFKEAYSNLADALTSARRFDEARAALDAALGLDPDYVGARINEINLMKALGQKKEALAKVEAILAQTRHVEALNLKGALLLETGDAHAAVRVLEEARSLDSRNPSVLNNLGNAYLATSRPGKAIEAYRSAVILAPGMAEAQANLALALLTQIQHGAPRGEYLALAKEHLAKAQALDPKMPQLFVAEGILKAQHQDDREGAQAAYEKALALQPESVQALMGLASIAADMGERRRARELYQRAAQLAPDDTDVMTSYIFALNYDPEATPKEIYAAARAYGQHIQSRVGAPYTDWPNRRDPDKRLKVGFVSGDFRRHPVAYFTVGLFEQLPRDQVEVYAYHNHAASDDMTARIKAAVDHWRVIADQSTEAVCELIRADGIDILIDLSGHTGYHRLDVFAKKPAPVSASWLGFVTTTGIDAIDYFLADGRMFPDNAERYFAEQPLAMPVNASLDLRDDLVTRVMPPPVLRKGTITFGSFNNIIKLNERCLNAWAALLQRVPQSRLLLKYRQLTDEVCAKRLLERFREHGIEESRIQLSASIPSRHQALEYYGELDIALDPFPYNGATTTLEALFMGVPVLAIAGNTFAGRMSSAYLRALGLDELVAPDINGYLEAAVALAHDIDRLRHYRASLRERLLASPLGDPRQFAPIFAATLRRLWTHNRQQAAHV
jgi:predicted O-linked N-acetylglucosamine transferase (SPINDLY family)